MKRAAKMCPTCPFRGMPEDEKYDLAVVKAEDWPCHEVHPIGWGETQCRGHYEARRKYPPTPEEEAALEAWQRQVSETFMSGNTPPAPRRAPMNWSEYLMGFAAHAARKSKDTTKVGAVLVGEDNAVLLAAYNGPPRGVDDKPDRFKRPAKYLFASHAEANLIAFAAREGIRTEGKIVYCTHHPCASCARTLIQAGIAHVCVGPGTTHMPTEEFDAARRMFDEACVGVEFLGEHNVE